jgi:hypothetical protein
MSNDPVHGNILRRPPAPEVGVAILAAGGTKTAAFGRIQLTGG